MKANTPYDIGAAFEAVENELIASMIRNMKRHKLEEEKEDKQWSMWQAEQLKALEQYRKANKAKFGEQFKVLNGQIDGLIWAARNEGEMQQEIAILNAIKKGFPAKKVYKGATAEFFKLNERKLEALIQATVSDMEKAETAILRMADDKYRQVIFNAQVYANTGAGTYEKAVDMATKDMLSAGLNCIEYKNGARHTLEDYAYMAIQTACKRAYLQGEGVKRKEWGIYTVIMNKRGNPCPKCLPFCGKVLIDDVWSGGPKSGISPVTGIKYPLMSSAVAAGLYHPRCRDSHTTYFEGISTPPDDKYTKEELDQIAEDYQKEQKEQYAERQEKKFGRLAKHSLDEENQKRYAQKEKEWKAWGAYHTGNEELPDYIAKYIEKATAKPIAKGTGSGIIESGARITNMYSKEAIDFADMYYREIRSFSTDVKKISENLGKSESDIREIKAYLFEDNSLYDPDTGKWRRFDPDCAIAQSWQRLMIGKDIKKHDRILIEHELLEMQIKKENPGIDHYKAHELATEKYNYDKEAAEYYGALEKHKENKR